jgi:epoxyqueuosine reductase
MRGMTAEGGLAPGELACQLLAAGASLVGVADLSPLPEEASRGLPTGVAIALALSPQVVAGLEAGPTAAYQAEYHRANAELARLAAAAADLLRARGHRAEHAPPTVRAVAAGSDPVPLPHKTVATRAGLGWIGHSALLVTPDFGCAVRLTSILTDAPLPAAAPVERSRCGTCRRCVDACPAAAISGRPWAPGLPREAFYDAGACREKATALAASRGIEVTICGICIRACPFTQRYLRRAGLFPAMTST